MRSHQNPAATDDDLPADVIRFWAAEEVHGVGRFLRRAGAPQRDHLVHGCEQLRLHADLDGAALDLDDLLLRFDRLRQPGPDQAEGDAIDVDVIAAPLFGEQRPSKADDRGFAGTSS